MTAQDLVHLGGTVLLHWATAAGVASVVVHSRVRWWETEMGRHLMAYMTAFAVVLTLSCIALDTLPPPPPVPGDSLWFQTLRLVVFVAVPIAMTWRLWLQIKAQRLAPGHVPAEPPPATGS